ncbi:adenylate/guanylate cyclase domain-containing protein [Priestia megaterium]
MHEWTIEELDEIKQKIKEVLDVQMEVEQYEGDVVPSVDDLEDANEGLLVDCAILFVDIRGSTTLSDTSWAKSMAKIYRAFVRAMVMCVYNSGGRVRQIVGDRVMGVFVNDEEVKATEKALQSAKAILTVVEKYFNPECKSKVNGKEIQCGVGIDYGKVLLTQVGMKAEQEEAKDLVWAGKIANIASKHTDMAEAGEIFVTKRYYDNLPFSYKGEDSRWEAVIRLKSDSLFEGYANTNYYLDCVNEEETKEFSEQVRTLSSDGNSISGLNPNDVVTQIVTGMQSQISALLERFEPIVRRETELKYTEQALAQRETALKQQEESLKQRMVAVDRALEFKKNQVEYKLKSNFLSDNMNSYKFLELLERMDELIELGGKINKTKVNVHSDLYYFRLVNYMKKHNLEVAYLLIEEAIRNNLYLPWADDIIEVVEKLNKKIEISVVIRQNLQNYKPDARTLDIFRKMILKLNLSNPLIEYERKLIE